MPHSRWGTEALWEQLAPLLPGLSIEVVARTESTNSQLLERSRLASPRGEPGAGFGRRAGDTQPCLLVAEHQTGGRGRQGRTWRSAPGASLTFSLALPIERDDWSGLSLAVGLAIAEALDPPDLFGEPRLRLKWPNDLMLALDAHSAGRKLGGVLIESVAIGERRMAIVGVGLNVQPLDAGEVATGFACLQEIEPDASAPSALARVAPALAQALVDFQRGGFAVFAERYAARDLLRGRAVTTTMPELPEGVAEGVDGATGALLVRAGGTVHHVSSGEVSVRLADAAPGVPADPTS